MLTLIDPITSTDLHILYNNFMSLDFLKRTKDFKKFLQALRAEEKGLSISGLISPAKPYFLSLLSQEWKKPIIFIQSGTSSLPHLEEECRFFLSQLGSKKKSVALPPLFESPYQEISPSLETVSSRMHFLFEFLQGSPSILITSFLGLLHPLPHPQNLPRLFLKLRPGNPIGRDSLLERLAEFGYKREELVNSHGEYAFRGGIVDVFSPWENFPFRLEFSGDEIISLREFQASDQRSIRKIDDLLVPSLREFPGHPMPFFTNLIQSDQSVFFDRYYRGALVIIDDYEGTMQEWEQTGKELREQFDQLSGEKKALPPPDEIYPSRLVGKIQGEAVRIVELDEERNQGFHFSFQSVPRFANKIPFFLDYVKKMQEEREQCFIYIRNEGVGQKLSILLNQHQIRHVKSSDPFVFPEDGSLVLLLGDLSHGFRYPAERITYFSEKEVFTEERVLISRPQVGPFVSDFRDLKSGDYIVHTDYGIGVFKGLEKMKIDGKEHEFIEIHYQEGDKLFVPTEDLNLIQKYSNIGTLAPSLNKLGTSAWKRTKERTRKAIENFAKELLQLYARRKSVRGHRYTPGGTWQTEFEQTFEYEETEDQIQAIKEVYGDMESESPMDRLLCGDVGYGKTEVAMRASFKAVMDGKQVAVLCPTTVLAVQHLNTFQNRMMLFPVRIESLTRFHSRVQQRQIIEDIRKGLVDIVIGTHRLLSKDVAFKDLGLLIIDEEQRFGVAHKEKIKRMKTSVDVFTMTATPIPRTLNLSLSGLRDISIIETPPKDRLAIHTVVTPFSQKLITSAVKKELARGGQVYFVHNRIQDIDAIAQLIKTWVNDARVAVIHGRISGVTLERRMIDFIQRKYNILVATTIIENGIDIPLVNTLIVNRADRFGLAQLYQLRGRVGRSSRQAVAYFLAPPFIELTPLSKERLKALQEFSELGSGFRLAAKDLEIRGAGNFLGSQQHGYMEAVGFDYYMHLLGQTVKKLRGESVEEVKSEINLRVNIRIPDDYLPQTNLRLNLYKRISSIEELKDIDRIRKEVEDRYGPFPQGLRNLLFYGAVKFLAQKIKIKSIDRIETKIVIKFFPTSVADLDHLPVVLEKFSGSITPQGIMYLNLSSENESDIMSETIFALKQLSGM
jgi:transcription-repair coupling factor (superfamily II helicase)